MSADCSGGSARRWTTWRTVGVRVVAVVSCGVLGAALGRLVAGPLLVRVPGVLNDPVDENDLEYQEDKEALYWISATAVALVALVLAVLVLRRWNRRESFHRYVEQHGNATEHPGRT